jgi:YHS domain-containing protein
MTGPDVRDVAAMKSFLSLVLLTVLAVVAGCATTGQQATTANGTATCEVCRYRNDLACVCVKVADDTPRTEYQGSTYYFCSEECREAFLKKPAKYSARH